MNGWMDRQTDEVMDRRMDGHDYKNEIIIHIKYYLVYVFILLIACFPH